MDIYVGKTEKIRNKNLNTKIKAGGMIEGEIITVRRSRSVIHEAHPEKERRHRISQVDPGEAKVLVLLIDDATGIPKDFSGKKYRALVRFCRVP